jgi:hypothetical protein
LYSKKIDEILKIAPSTKYICIIPNLSDSSFNSSEQNNYIPNPSGSSFNSSEQNIYIPNLSGSI